MAIKLRQETEKRLLASIKRYFSEELESEIGDLKASLMLDFCMREIGPSIYNQAISDAQTVLRDNVADLEGNCHEPEEGYWDK